MVRTSVQFGSVSYGGILGDWPAGLLFLFFFFFWFCHVLYCLVRPGTRDGGTFVFYKA